MLGGEEEVGTGEGELRASGSSGRVAPCALLCLLWSSKYFSRYHTTEGSCQLFLVVSCHIWSEHCAAQGQTKGVGVLSALCHSAGQQISSNSLCKVLNHQIT